MTSKNIDPIRQTAIKSIATITKRCPGVKSVIGLKREISDFSSSISSASSAPGSSSGSGGGGSAGGGSGGGGGGGC